MRRSRSMPARLPAKERHMDTRALTKNDIYGAGMAVAVTVARGRRHSAPSPGHRAFCKRLWCGLRRRLTSGCCSCCGRAVAARQGSARRAPQCKRLNSELDSSGRKGEEGVLHCPGAPLSAGAHQCVSCDTRTRQPSLWQLASPAPAQSSRAGKRPPASSGGSRSRHRSLANGPIAPVTADR